jgi:Trp operon repressor
VLPLLGEIESRIFNLLLVFGALAMVGFGYVSYEIFLHNHRVSEAVRRGFNPYISGEPVRREEMFYGRHELLQRIVATLHNNSIMIHGERRIGKTTLLYQLANALRQVEDEEYWFVPVLIDLEGTTEDKLFLQLAEDIYQTAISLPALTPSAQRSLQFLACHRWSTANPEDELPSQYTDREFGRDLRTIVRMLEQYAEQQQDQRQLRLILLLDEVDTLSQFNPIYQQQLRRIFMRDFAATLGAIVAGIAISKEWDRVESPWFNLFNEIAMAPFSHAEAVELLVEPVRGYYIYEPAALEFIVTHSDGRPYRIQQYGLEAVNHMLKHKRRRIQMGDVEYAHAQILTTSANLSVGIEPMPGPGMQSEAKRETVCAGGLASATPLV